MTENGDDDRIMLAGAYQMRLIIILGAPSQHEAIRRLYNHGFRGADLRLEPRFNAPKRV